MKRLQTSKYTHQQKVSYNPSQDRDININLNLDLATVDPFLKTGLLSNPVMLFMWVFVAGILMTVALFIMIKIYF